MDVFVDASAIVAMIAREPEAKTFADRLSRERGRCTSPIAVWEAVRGVARVRGVEVSVDVPLTHTLRLNATGTLTDSEQLSGANIGAALNYTPKQQASASLNWRPDKRFSAFVRAVYRG